MEQDMGYQRLQPHIETLLQWYWTTTNHYHFWLIELARRFATQQYYDAMHRPGESWCGSTAAIPPAILTDLQQQGMQAGLDIITWLNDTETHKVHLVEVHDAIQDALRDPTLSPYEPDFSVVLLRSDFVLVSEKNHVKMHKNQWLSTPLSPLDIPWRATNRGKHSEGWGADACAVT